MVDHSVLRQNIVDVVRKYLFYWGDQGELTVLCCALLYFSIIWVWSVTTRQSILTTSCNCWLAMLAVLCIVTSVCADTYLRLKQKSTKIVGFIALFPVYGAAAYSLFVLSHII